MSNEKKYFLRSPTSEHCKTALKKNIITAQA
jgi:hypothetical protein